MMLPKSLSTLVVLLLLASSSFGQYPIPSGWLDSPLPPIPSGLLNSPSPAIPSGLFNSPSPPIPSGYATDSPLPSGLTNSPSPAIPTEVPTSSVVPSGASPSIASSPSRAASPSRTPAPGSSLTFNFTSVTLEAFPDETCKTPIDWFFLTQVAYFGAKIQSSPSGAISARNLRSVCFQQGNSSCYQVSYDTYPAANGREPVFSVDLAETTIVTGEPYNVYATVALLLSNGTTQEVRVFTTINADDGSNIQTPSSVGKITPGWNAAIVLLMLGLINFF